ncbi:hypothetical protein ABIE61_001800 [Marinobacterium sp. MBR-111]|jgi:hypothetical protein
MSKKATACCEQATANREERQHTISLIETAILALILVFLAAIGGFSS